MKLLFTEGIGASQTTTNAQDEKIPVYETKTAAETDLVNLEVGQIIATNDKGSELSNPVDVVQDGNMHAVTSNAVFDYVNNVEVINPTINTDSNYNVLEVKVIKTGNLVSIAGIITVKAQLESVVVATGLPVPLITKLVEYDNFIFLFGQKATNSGGQAVKVDKYGRLIVYTNSGNDSNYYFSGMYITE